MGLGGVSIYTRACIFGSARAETEAKEMSLSRVGKHNGGCLVSLLHPPRSFPADAQGLPALGAPRARNVGVEWGREGAGAAVLAAGTGRSSPGGTTAAPPRRTKHAPPCFSG